jgi:cholesterol oxidase
MSYRPKWLAEDADALIEELGKTADPDPHFDVVVIGSGYGGAVAAARFARALKLDGTTNADGTPKRVQLRVCVLERGAEYIPGSFPSRISDVPWHVRMSRPDDADVKGRADGLFDFRLGADVSALVGNGLGGGSLINAGVVEAPERDVFMDEQWPAALRRDYEELRAMCTEVATMLGAVDAPTDLAKHQRLRGFAKAVKLEARPVSVALRRNAGDLGADGRNRQGVAQSPCIRCGDCVTGCNFKAKNTLPMNYLAEAKALGAELYVGATVSHVERAGDLWHVRWCRTGAPHPETEEDAKRTHCIRARHVVIAAGTFGSTEILMRSRAHGLHVSGKLGRRFSTNGDMISVLYGEREEVNAAPPEQQPPNLREVGPTITGLFSNGRARKDRIVVEELAVPGLLRRLFEEIVTTGALPVQLGRMDWSQHGPSDEDPAAVDGERIRRTQVFAAMGDDGAQGRLELVEGWSKGGADGAIRVEWKDAGKAPIYQAQDKLLSESEKLGGIYLRNPLWKPLPEPLAGMLSGRKLEGGLFTVHPLGGCPMGDDWKAGVVDDLGRVYDPSEPADLARVYPGLLVLDGSIVPVALGVNPLLTIAALAERATRRYCDLQGWAVPQMQPRFAKDMPQVGGAPDREEIDTAVRFSERMTGPLRLAAGGLAHETALEVTFDDIGRKEPIAEFLRKGPHRVDINEGTLQICLSAAEMKRRAGEKGKAGAESRPASVKGWVQWMERAPSCAGSRTLSGLIAYVRNRLRADLAQDRRQMGIVKALLNAKGIHNFLRLASHVGETRYLRYELYLQEDLKFDGKTLLPAKTRVDGLKTFRYAKGANPWLQLSELSVSVKPPHEALRDAGVLTIDLKHLIERFTAMFQITRQRDQPTAMLDVASIALFMLRIVFKIHFWSFRAPEYEKFDPERARRRMPGPLDDDLGFEQIPVWVQRTDKNGAEKPPLSLVLTRYWKKAEEKVPDGKERYPASVPVMLLHGFGSGGVQFAHPKLENNLVRHLARHGHDVWVAELRTSIALPSSRNQWTLDEIAREDIPALADAVLARTRHDRLDVVAHCIGSAMFCTAVLGDSERRFYPKVRSATLLQVGPLISLSPGNRFRGYMAAAMRRYMLTDHVDSSIDDRATALDTVIDRLLMTYPYPESERRFHAPESACDPHTHIANCNRSAAVFGRLVEHANVREKTLDLLGDMIGHTNLTTFEQTGQYAFAERLTDRDATNLYVTDANVLERFRFPVRFLHGENNDVFDIETSHRSLKLLQDLFRGRHNSKIEVLRGYGHLDPLIGDRVHVDVFPRITGFLKSDAGSGNAVPPDDDLRHDSLRRPLIGPVLGWTRWEGRRRVARLWCRTDDEKSYAQYLVAVVLNSKGPVPGYVFKQPLMGADGSDRAGELDLLGIMDVPLPGDDDDYEIVLLGAHRASAANWAHDDLDTRPPGAPAGQQTGLQQGQTGIMRLKRQSDFRNDVLARRAQWLLSLKDADAATQVNEPGYFERIDSVKLSRELLARLGGRQADGGEPAKDDILFAIGCCRFSATLIDRERADASFGVLRELIAPRTPGRNGQPKQALRLALLLLLGDQIYADATAGLFDPKSRRGRFDDSYRETWTAPNARAVLRRLPTYMMMDDHEIADDWHPDDRPERTDNDLPEGRRWGLIAFEDYQLLHSPQPLQAKPAQEARQPRYRYWYNFDSCGFHFFVCDTRGTRQGRTRIMSEEQMRALKGWLVGPQRPRDGRPLFVVSPSVVLPESRTHGADDWSGFSESLKDLLRFIDEQQLRVVFLCGDSHLAMTTRISLPGGGKCLCIASAPLYAPMPFANARREDAYDTKTIPLDRGNVVYERCADSVATGDGVTIVGAGLKDGKWCVTVDLYERSAEDPTKIAKKKETKSYELD